MGGKKQATCLVPKTSITVKINMLVNILFWTLLSGVFSD